MASVTTGVPLRADIERPSRPRFWPGRRFVAEVFDGADDALAALESVEGGLVSTCFQTLNWLTVHFEELAPAHGAIPRLVVVSERNSGEVCLILPLLVRTERRLKVARFADLGVSYYGAPILGPAAPVKRKSIRRVWRAAWGALKDIDLVRLEKMPAEISGKPNPLVTQRMATRDRRSGHVVDVEGTIDEFLSGRAKKYRKEVERCQRLWEKEGQPHFARASSPAKIARGYTLLEEQQSQRHATRDPHYILGEQPHAAFYERIVMDGSDLGFSHMFTLGARGEVIATLFGVEHDGTFTLLRIAHGGDRWGHLSPGRLIVIEAMKYFVERGVRRFDMGVGDHAFTRGFGATEVPLYSLIVARDLAAVPRAVFHRWKARARQFRLVRALARRHLRRKSGH